MKRLDNVGITGRKSANHYMSAAFFPLLPSNIARRSGSMISVKVVKNKAWSTTLYAGANALLKRNSRMHSVRKKPRKKTVLARSYLHQ